MTHTFRSKQEIQAYAMGSAELMQDATLEVLLDIRDLLQEQQLEKTLNKHVDQHIASDANEWAEPEKDPLFDEAVAYVANAYKSGELIRAEGIALYLGTTYGKGSALIDQLEAEGVITKKDVNGRRHVV